MKNELKVNEDRPLLVATGKSSRLDAIRKKAGLLVDQVELDKNQQVLIPGLKQSTKESLQQANSIIDERITAIMASYSSGKENTFFKIKYGDYPDKIKKKKVLDVFKLLALDSKVIKHFQLIEALYLDGSKANM